MSFIISVGVALTDYHKYVDKNSLTENTEEQCGEELVFLLNVYEGVEVANEHSYDEYYCGGEDYSYGGYLGQEIGH